MKKLQQWIALASLAPTLAFAGQGPLRGIVYVVDVSGSMANVLGNVSRSIVEHSEKADISPLSKALVLFGVSNGCGPANAKVQVPFDKDNNEAIKREAKAMKAIGATDILSGLNIARDIILKGLENTGYCANVVLFTDDEDTCGNGTKHFEVMKQLKTTCTERNQKFKVDNVEVAKDFDSGFQLDVITSTKDEATLLFLQELAKISGGKAHPVISLDEIGTALENIVEARRKKNTGVPQTSSAGKTDTTETNTPTSKTEPKKKPQEKQAPATQGGEKPKEQEKK